MSEIPNYISQSQKPEQLQKLINEALYILSIFGVPLEGISKRRMERIAMAFLAFHPSYVQRRFFSCSQPKNRY